MLRVATLFLLLIASACQGTPGSADAGRPPLLEGYVAGHYLAIPRVSGPALGWERFLLELPSRRLILLGDVHDDRALHERYRELLSALSVELDHERGRPVWLLVEHLGEEEGRVLRPGAPPPSREAREGALTLLRRTLHERWPASWMEDPRLDRGFYQDLFRIAALGGWGLAGLEPIPRLPLEERDARITAAIQGIANEAPDALVVVVLGHAHLLGEGRVFAGCAGLSPLALLPRLSPESPPAPSPLPFLRVADGLWLVRPGR